MRNKKIALVFLGDYRFDGRSYNMIETLVNAQNFVDVIYRPCSDVVGLRSKYLKEITLNISNKKFYKYLDWTKQVRAKIKNANYDFLIASDLYSLLPICLIKSKAHIVYDSREIYSELFVNYQRPVRSSVIKKIEKHCIEKVSTVLVSADSDKKYLSKLYSHKKNINYYTIYNFPKNTNANKKTNYLKTKYNIKNKNILLYQGVIQEGRGIGKMIQIIKNTSDLVGFIVGSGELRPHYVSQVKKYKLEHKIYFINRVPYKKLLEITASADIGLALISSLSISYKYALPNKLFEYAISGIPCLSSKLPNMQKFINKYKIGLCVEDDLRSCVDAINFLLTKKQRLFYSKNKLSSSLSWSSQEKNFLNIFNQ